ncbi:MAG: hypothetical protein ACOYVJ_00260 [Nitrospirota bacterium]
MDSFSQKVRIPEWSYQSDKFGVQRLRLLQQADSYSAIAYRISDEMTDIKFCVKKGNKAAKNKTRAEFLFSVKRETVDVFFNSSQGYRAQYYLEPQRGIECNRFMIELIKDKIIEVAKQSSQSLMTFEQVKKSIQYGSARIWISEKDSTLDQTSHRPEEILALNIPRWVNAVSQVLSDWDANQQPSPTIKTRALLGVQAPEGIQMKVLGAWLDDKDKEFVVPSKIDRAQHIYNYGFS